MGTFEHFPYTNFHEINLDEVVKDSAEAKQIAEEAKEKVDTFNERLNHVESLEPIVLDNQDRSQRNQDAINRIDGTIQDIITDAEDIQIEINNQAEKNAEQDTRLSVLEGVAFDGITPPTKDEFEAANDAIKNQINQLREIVETGYSVESNIIPDTVVNLIDVGERGQASTPTILSNNYRVTGYYYKIGALIKGELMFYYDGAGDVQFLTPERYFLAFNTPADMPVPKNDVSGLIHSRSHIDIGDVVYPDLNTRGQMLYWFNKYFPNFDYRWVYRGILKSSQGPDNWILQIPFEYVTEHQPEEWDFEIYDREIRSSSDIIRTGIRPQASENINKDYEISFRAKNIADATAKTQTILAFPDEHNTDNMGNGEFAILRSTLRPGSIMLQRAQQWNPIFTTFDATDSLTVTITRIGTQVTVTSTNGAGEVNSQILEKSTTIKALEITIGGTSNTAASQYWICQMDLDYFKFRWL